MGQEIETLEQVIASNLQRARTETGWSQGMLARAMAEKTGREWTRDTVASIERTARGVSLTELVELAAILGCTVASLASAHRQVMKLGKRVVTAEDFCNLLFGDAEFALIESTAKSLLEQAPADREKDRYRMAASAEQVERRAARCLDLSAEVLDYLCGREWGHGFYEERERRVKQAGGSLSSPGAERAARGHATRNLIKELQTAVNDPKVREQLRGITNAEEP